MTLAGSWLPARLGAETVHSWGPWGVHPGGEDWRPGHSGRPRGSRGSAGWALRVRTLGLGCWGSESRCHPLLAVGMLLPLCVGLLPLKVETRRLILFLGLWEEWANELSWILARGKPPACRQWSDLNYLGAGLVYARGEPFYDVSLERQHLSWPWISPSSQLYTNGCLEAVAGLVCESLDY